MALLGVRARKGGPKFQKGAARETPKTLRPERGEAPAETHREKKAPRRKRGVSGTRKPARNGEAEEAAVAAGCAPGPSSRRRLTSLPSRLHGPGWRPAPVPPTPSAPSAPVWNFRFQWERRPLLHRLWISTPRPGIPSLQGPHPGSTVLLPTRRLYLLLASTPGLCRRVRNSEPRGGSAPLSRSHCTLSSSARPANSSGRGIGGAGEGLLTSAQRGDTAALRPAVEKQLLS